MLKNAEIYIHPIHTHSDLSRPWNFACVQNKTWSISNISRHSFFQKTTFVGRLQKDLLRQKNVGIAAIILKADGCFKFLRKDSVWPWSSSGKVNEFVHSRAINSSVRNKGWVSVIKCVIALLAWNGIQRYDFRNLVNTAFTDCLTEFDVAFSHKGRPYLKIGIM